MKWLLLFCAAVPVLAFWIIFMPHTPLDVPLEVARAQVPCGELLLTQTFTGMGDPYRVWLYFKSTGDADWTQHHVDGDAPYWWGGLKVDGAGATLTLFGSAVGRFECQARAFNRWARTMPPVRTVRDPFDVEQTQR